MNLACILEMLVGGLANKKKEKKTRKKKNARLCLWIGAPGLIEPRTF